MSDSKGPIATVVAGALVGGGLVYLGNRLAALAGPGSPADKLGAATARLAGPGGPADQVGAAAVGLRTEAHTATNILAMPWPLKLAPWATVQPANPAPM